MGFPELVKKTPRAGKSERVKSHKGFKSLQDLDRVQTEEGQNVEGVRRRRGYRPLSVFTPSMFFPFGTETIKSMDILKHQELDSRISAETDPAKSNIVSTKAQRRSANHLIQLQKSASTFKDSFNSSNTVAQQESTGLKGTFPALFTLPPPDLSLHPSLSPHPFGSVSDSPNLICTTPVEEVRQFCTRGSESSSFERHTDSSTATSLRTSARTSDSSEFISSAERKRFVIPDHIRSPDPILGKRGFSARMENSPLANRFKEIVIPEQLTPSIAGEDIESKSVTSHGLRKLSDLFKARINADRLSSLTQEEEEPPRLLTPRAVLEERLRTSTYSPTYAYQANSAFPRHPETGRNWKSRNLKCTTCTDFACVRCGRACCAYRAAVLALDNHKDNPQGRSEALQRIQEITMLYPYGKEAPTFLRCSGGPGGGCEQTMCPDCCGQCPDPSCKDIQCYRCKNDPWAYCDWHIELSAIAMMMIQHESAEANSPDSSLCSSQITQINTND